MLLRRGIVVANLGGIGMFSVQAHPKKSSTSGIRRSAVVGL
jgi:hypothetical protein